MPEVRFWRAASGLGCAGYLVLLRAVAFFDAGLARADRDLAYFYPTSVLETAYDIIFFWVARMIMMGMYFTGEVPFHTVYLHGLVRNEQGEKISKSMEDAWRYDPLFIIKEYGLDPLRFTLLTGSTPGNDMKLSESRIEANRNFCNTSGRLPDLCWATWGKSGTVRIVGRARSGAF